MTVPPDSWAPGDAAARSPVQVCVRHPDRPTGLRCVRCDRPACPQCLREASVGYQCVDCVRDGLRDRSRRTARTVSGAAAGGQNLVVTGLVAINIAIFILTVAQAGSVQGNAGASLFRQWALSPAAVADGEVWRLFTSGFLHFGVIHLAFNMIALWIIGRDLEVVLGSSRFLAVYLVSLLGGSAAVFLFEREGTLTAGASGAVFGVMGGLAVVLLRLRRSPAPAITLIVLNVVIGFLVPQISILGHLGGLVFGTAATAAMVYSPRERRTTVQIAAVAGLLAVVVLAVLVRGLQFG